MRSRALLLSIAIALGAAAIALVAGAIVDSAVLQLTGVGLVLAAVAAQAVLTHGPRQLAVEIAILVVIATIAFAVSVLAA